MRGAGRESLSARLKAHLDASKVKLLTSGLSEEYLLLLFVLLYQQRYFSIAKKSHGGDGTASLLE